VTGSEGLERISVPDYARDLKDPFTMIDLVQIDDLSLSVFLCQGTMPQHRHLDQDELFLVHSGTMNLDSRWGTAVLHPGELVVAPKGVDHRSSSGIRSLVLLLQPRLMVNRRNGDRRLFGLKNEGQLQKVSVPAVGRQLVVPFHRVVLADLDTFALTVMLCRGTGPWECRDRQDSLVFCYDGQLILRSELGDLSLAGGELTAVPKGVQHQFSSNPRALVLGVERHEQPGLPLPE
jgi:homogentisate 1,2-dioxygenase